MKTPSRPTELRPRLIEANGLEFAYLECGEGPLVLCLHGFPDTAWSFRPLLHALAAAGFHAVAPFMRGYAPTAVPKDGDYTSATLGRDVLALIEHFGADRAHLIGHDWGAAAAQSAAALRPDRIGKMVNAGLPHLNRFALHRTRAQRKASSYMLLFQLRGWIEHRLSKGNYSLLRRMVAASSPTWSIPDSYWQPLMAAFSEPKRLSAALGYYRALPLSMLRMENWKYLYKPTQVPTLVIYGEQDRAVLPEMFQGNEKLYPRGYRLIGLPNIGHFMHIEASHDFCQMALSYLREP